MPATTPVQPDTPAAGLEDVHRVPTGERERMRLFVFALIGVTLAVSVATSVLAFLTASPQLAVAGFAVGSVGAWAAWAWPRADTRKPDWFPTRLAALILAVVVVVAVVVPGLGIVLPAGVLVPVVIAMPYVRAAPLRRLMVSAWLIGLVVAILGQVGLPSAGLPSWVLASLRVLSSASVAGVALLLLWQYRHRLEASATELGTLVAMSRDLAQTLDPQLIGHLMARHLARAAGADACLISRWDRAGDCVATVGRFPVDALPGVADTYDLPAYPLTRRVLERQETVELQVSDARADPAEVSYLRTVGQGTLVMLPLMVKRRTVGLVELSTARERPLDEHGLELAATLATEAAMALENAQLYQELRHQAFHDALTHLPNRALFHDRLDHALDRGERRTVSLAVLFIDLDDFKNVNDRLGHVRGDQLLAAVAERLTSCLRAGDTAARLGGDEFAVLLEDLEDGSPAAVVAERIMEAMSLPFRVADVDLPVSASIGVAFAGSGGDTADDLLRNADFAMYQAKEAGKARVALFQPSMRAGASERRDLQALLAGALERDELRLQYQPMIELDRGAIVGVEALVRWHRPGRDVCMPAEFIPQAEQSGLIVPIGRWVLGEACRQVREWQTQSGRADLFVSVNLSARQFQHPALRDDIMDALSTSGLAPAALLIEITESVLMHHTPTTISTLEALRDAGIRVAIDDFGTGYSSLSYLQRFPIDVLKVDRSFVEGATEAADGGVLARAIVEIGGALDLVVVAEGIERAEELVAFRSYGCDMGQGYLFAKPLDSADMEELLRAAIPPWGALVSRSARRAEAMRLAFARPR